jgi:DNA adenine methylase
VKIGALSPWYGSKRTLAATIVAHLGEHRTYWEPFCGSMAVLLAKPRATMETVNDLHGDLVNMAKVIQCPAEGPRLYRRLRRVLFAQKLLEDSKAVIDGQPLVPGPDRAFHFFIYSWFGRNGVVGSKGGVNFCVRYTSNGGQPATRWEAAVASIPAWRERLRGVTILSAQDGITVCERIEDKNGTVIYSDPPYLVKGEQYVHDFNTANHERLAAALCLFRRTRCVVSYYDHPDLARLYPDWQKVPCDVTKAMVSMGQRDGGGAVKAPEVLLVNRPPPEMNVNEPGATTTLF